MKRKKAQDFKRSRGKHPIRTLLFLTQPTVLLIVTLLVLAYWRIPTRVQIELVVDQETFTVSPTDATALLRAINEQTILVREGKISYPKYPEIKAIAFVFPDQIEIEELEKFRIEEVALNTERKEIRLRLEGVVKHIRTGSPGSFQDRRLTRFDTLKNSRWAVILGITGWIVATIIGWYRLYEELKG